jgi:hypothetical protein
LLKFFQLVLLGHQVRVYFIQVDIRGDSVLNQLLKLFGVLFGGILKAWGLLLDVGVDKVAEFLFVKLC